MSRGRGGFDRTPSFLDRFTHAYPRELQSFVRAVERRSELAVSGEDGLAAVVLATAAERSLEIGQSVHLRHRHVDGSLRYEMEENYN